MLVVLIFDRIMSHLRPHVLMCQKCQLIFRGIPQEQVMKFDDFDLEVYDRLHYKDRIEKIESSEQ